jgi:hypothetical protein
MVDIATSTTQPSNIIMTDALDTSMDISMTPRKSSMNSSASALTPNSSGSNSVSNGPSWRFAQCFGDKNEGADVSEGSTISFNLICSNAD